MYIEISHTFKQEFLLIKGLWLLVIDNMGVNWLIIIDSDMFALN